MIHRIANLAGQTIRLSTIRMALGRVEPRLILFVITLLLYQIALLSMLWLEMIALFQYLAFHCIGSFTAFCHAALFKGDVGADNSRHARLQIVGWTALLGPLGPVISSALLVPRRLDAACSDSPPRDPQIDQNRSKRLHAQLLDKRVRLVGPSNTKPLLDVLAEGSQSEKLEALGVIYRRYEAELSSVLKRGLQDTEPSVRVLAATVLARLHGAYVQKIGVQQEASASDPGCSEHWRKLADARLDYASSGLLENARALVQADTARRDLPHIGREDIAHVLGRIGLTERLLNPERISVAIPDTKRHRRSRENAR